MREKKHCKDSWLISYLDKIAESILKMLQKLRKHRTDVQFNFKISVLEKKRKELHMLEISLTNEQKVRVTAKPVTDKGTEVPIDGSITGTPSDPDTVVNQIDPTTIEIITPDSGDRTVVISADADPGDGVTTIEDSVLLHISNPIATSLGLTATTPETK